MSATLVANHREVVKTLAPFFPGKIHFRSDKGNYNCALCGLNVRDNDAAALSYGASHYGTWVHVACTRAAKTQIIEDAKAKDAAKRAALKGNQKARKQATEQDKSRVVTDTTSQTEAKYESLMQQALDAINALQIQNAGLVAENDQLKAHLKAVTTQMLTLEAAAA